MKRYYLSSFLLNTIVLVKVVPYGTDQKGQLMGKVNDTVLSIKMSKEEKELISSAAEQHGEKLSGYVRGVLLDHAQENPFTGKDVVRILLGVSYDLRRLSPENCGEVIPEINEKGAALCQFLSSK